MTAPEYIQLRAFARVDGVKLFALWLASFVCYVAGLRSPGLGMVALLLAFITPFVTVRLLKKYRDTGLEGVISFRRGWGYVIFLFFYASLLFALAQFVYFAFLDKGFFAQALNELFSTQESSNAMQVLGMGASVGEMMQQLSAMRPIDLVLNILTSNLLIGCLLGLPVAALCKRNRVEQVK